MTSSSPSLAAPPSQNTASVVRFRCLYTHDLRRKAKRWQDGYLRYHTFNKRVMVFDEPGNFIGDLHWRQDEMIQDGDELELDKGVLIQVGESMEKTETDITPLFETTRKASQASPSKSQLQSQSSQPKRVPVRSAVPSSQSSRSLKDLLGIKRTSVGPKKWPNEQRHATPPEASRPTRLAPSSLEDKDPGERPAAISLSEPTSVNKPAAAVQTVPAQSSVQAPVRKVRKILDPQTDPNPSRSASRPLATAQNTIAKPDQKSYSFSGDPQPSVSSPTVPSNSAPSAPKNTLQLFKSKPRKKLMYQALLPGQEKAPETTPSSDRTGPAGPEQRSQSVCTKRHLDELELTAFSSSDVTPPSPEPISTDINMIPGDSTMDVLAEMVEDPMSDVESEVPPAEHESNTSTNKDIPAATAPKPTPPIKSEPSPLPRRTIIDLDPDPEPSTGAVSHAEKPQSRNLQKSYSDPSAFHTVNSIQSRQLPSSTLNPHTTVKKSNEFHADCHDYNQMQMQDQMQDQGQSRVQEQGPWTCEAMDLFDFWPPGRLKTAV